MDNSIQKSDHDTEINFTEFKFFKNEYDRTTNNILEINSPFDSLLPFLIQKDFSSNALVLNKDTGEVIFKASEIREKVDEIFMDKKSKKFFQLDFESLSADTKKYLKSGRYALGESRKVDGNFRAVIIDKLNNNERVEDITLKEKKLNQSSPEDLSTQLKLKEIYDLLKDIQIKQNFQIDLERNNHILAPIFNARSKLLDFETEKDHKTKINLLKEADSLLEKAVSKVWTDLSTNKEFIVKLTKNHIYMYSTLETHSNYVLNDLQVLTKIIGFQLTINNLLGNLDKCHRILNSYYSIISLTTECDILRTDRNIKHLISNLFKNKSSEDNKINLLMLIHDNYRYEKTNINNWFNINQEFKELSLIQNEKLLIRNQEESYE